MYQINYTVTDDLKNNCQRFLHQSITFFLPTSINGKPASYVKKSECCCSQSTDLFQTKNISCLVLRQTSRAACPLTLSSLPPPLPNQQRTLDKLPTELRCRNFVAKHRLSMEIGAKRAKACMQCVHIPTGLSFCTPPLVVGCEMASTDAMSDGLGGCGERGGKRGGGKCCVQCRSRVSRC